MKKPRSLTVMIVLGILLLLGLLGNNIYHRIYSDYYLIDSVHYDLESTSTYHDVGFYNAVSLLYLCRYYFDVKMFGATKSYEQKIKEEYPFVESITISSFANNILILDIKFIKPSLRFLYKNTSYGAYGHHFIALDSADLLGNGIPLILLPIYLNTSSQAISGLLYNINIDKMLYDLVLLKTLPISGTITYIPGGDKYILRNNTLRIYFNAKKNMNQQLMTISTLISEYRGFNQLQQIDVGSLENPIVK